MKKKIISLCLVVALGATAVIGGTLAYFSDTDAEENVFTTGNVAIDLWEDFGDNKDETIEKLYPTTGKDANGKIINAIEKEVYVDNVGSEEAYVRVHIAIPRKLDDGDPNFDASKNVLHFNADDQYLGKDQWNWGKAETEDVGEFVGTGDEWNFYTAKIGTVDYNVYVVTYESALAGKTDAATATTPNAIHQVYLDKNVTNEDITKLNDILGNEWKILVAAEGTQVEGFDNAFDALNAAFGVPGKYTPDWVDTVEEGERTLEDVVGSFDA